MNFCKKMRTFTGFRMNQVASLGTACGPSLKRNSVLRGLDASVMDLGGSQGVDGAPPKVIDGLEGFDLFRFLFDWMIVDL